MWGGDPAAVGEGSFWNGAEGETRLDMDVPEDSDVLLGAQAPVEGGVCVCVCVCVCVTRALKCSGGTLGR